MGEFAAFIERSKAKRVSASGGLRPLTPRPGALPWTPLGAPPQTPVKGSRSARSPWTPLCQILNTPLAAAAVVQGFYLAPSEN